MDITKYLGKSTNEEFDGRALNNLQEKQEQKKKPQILPKKFKKKTAYHVWKYGNPETRRWASKKYR